MITVTCRHTGIEFEARSKAARNHPVVSEQLSRLDRMSYGPMMDALREMKERGERPTLEEFEQMVDSAIEIGRGRSASIRQSFLDARERRRERDRDFIYGRRVAEDEEDADFDACQAARSNPGVPGSGPDVVEG